MLWLCKNHPELFGKNDRIIIPDGGDPQGSTIEIAEKNLLWLQVHVMGKQTHGSRPDSGANACLAAADLTLRLHNLEKIFNKKDSLFEPDYSTFQPTKRAKNVEQTYKEQEKEVDNLILTRFDIERIMLILGEQDNVRRIYINFCNPWPKGKHRKKRLTHTRQLEKYKEFI